MILRGIGMTSCSVKQDFKDLVNQLPKRRPIRRSAADAWHASQLKLHHQCSLQRQGTVQAAMEISHRVARNQLRITMADTTPGTREKSISNTYTQDEEMMSAITIKKPVYRQKSGHWVDSQGTVTRTYGQGDGEGLSSPWHMVRGSRGQLVVADTNNSRVILVDGSGQLSCYLLTRSEGINAPTCVWLDETTSLFYVAHKTASGTMEIEAYKWPTAAPPPPTHSTTCTQHTLQVELLRYK